jgi:hypothetical protein
MFVALRENDLFYFYGINAKSGIPQMSGLPKEKNASFLKAVSLVMFVSSKIRPKWYSY